MSGWFRRDVSFHGRTIERCSEDLQLSTDIASLLQRTTTFQTLIVRCVMLLYRRKQLNLFPQSTKLQKMSPLVEEKGTHVLPAVCLPIHATFFSSNFEPFRLRGWFFVNLSEGFKMILLGNWHHSITWGVEGLGSWHDLPDRCFLDLFLQREKRVPSTWNYLDVRCPVGS